MQSEQTYFFDKPENIKKMLYVFYTCCVLLLLLDFVIHRHVYHSWENLWGFYPLYGCAGCVLLVLVAKWMRLILMRDENYYDPPESGKHSISETGVAGGNHEQL